MNYEIENGIGHIFVYDYNSNIMAYAYKLKNSYLWNVEKREKISDFIYKEILEARVNSRQEAIEELKNLFKGAKLIS